MTTNQSPHVLATLEMGFRTDSARLKTLEQDLATTLQHARQFGTEHGSPQDWNTNWHQQWDHAEDILHRIQALVKEMDDSILSSESDRLEQALRSWENIQTEDAKLMEALGAVRAQAVGLNAAARQDWNTLARTLESHLGTIQACSQALRIKLELLKTHPREQVERLVHELLAKLPARTRADGTTVENYEQECRQAAAELEVEHNKYLGFVDVVKSLLLWFETPEERTRKNLSLEVDHA